MESFIQLFSYGFMQNALIAGVLASIICGIIGVYIMLKRIVFMSGGIAHASFAGIGLGYLLKLNIFLSTLFFAVLSAFGIGAIKKHTKINEDSTIGILWAFGMALGIIFVGLSKGYSINLLDYLFGNIMMVSRQDIAIMAALAFAAIVFSVLLYKEYLIFIFDEEYGKVIGLPVAFLYYLLLAFVALSIVVLMKIVGIILVIALLTILPSAGRMLSNNVRNIMIISVLLSVFSVMLGLFMSYYFDLASGATIILSASFVFALVFSLKKLPAFIRH